MGKQYKRQIKPKKHLGQHFLINDSIAYETVQAIDDNGLPVLEIGPGTGALTQHLFDRFGTRVNLIEVDNRSVRVLEKQFPPLASQIMLANFLQLNIPKYFPNGVNIIGNFPYNISSQIVFTILQYEQWVPQMVGMFQKEVAERICAVPEKKQYGQLTVLREMHYKASYLFTVDKDNFDPPPKVQSAVIQLINKNEKQLPANIKAFKRFVKQAFSQRRKKMRNSLKQFFTSEQLNHEVFDRRPEQMSYEAFLTLFSESNLF